MADEGLRRLFQETCHCSRSQKDAPGAGGAAAFGYRGAPYGREWNDSGKE
jgi:hypothetical protein